MSYMIGQRVIFKDKINADIVEVICEVCVPERPDIFPNNDPVVWIKNPARGCKHWVNKDSVKPLPGGQL